MAVPGEKCNRCDFCGNELINELHVFCPISHKDPSDNNCWCICTECKVRFLNQIGPHLE